MNDIEAILARLFSMYPMVEVSEGLVLGYIDRLQNIPPNELKAVVDQCIDECRFLPTVSELKEMHRRLHNSVDPNKAAQGWLSVQRAMRDPATYTPEPSSFTPKFKDPLVGKAVEALGWYNLRISESPRNDQAQFERLYRMFAEQEASEQKLSNDYKQLRDNNGHKLLEETSE